MQKGPKEPIPEEQELDFQGLEEEEEEPSEGLDEEGPEAGKPSGWGKKKAREPRAGPSADKVSITRLGTGCLPTFRKRLLRNFRKERADRCGEEPRNSMALS